MKACGGSRRLPGGGEVPSAFPTLKGPPRINPLTERAEDGMVSAGKSGHRVGSGGRKIPGTKRGKKETRDRGVTGPLGAEPLAVIARF